MGEAERVPDRRHHQISEGSEAIMIALVPDGTPEGTEREWEIDMGDFKRTGEIFAGSAFATDIYAEKDSVFVPIVLPRIVDTLDDQVTIVAETADDQETESSNHIVSKELLTKIGMAMGGVVLTTLTGYIAFKWKQKNK